jgi:hypothetical protein
MTTRAHVESDFGMDGVKIAIRHEEAEARWLRMFPLDLGTRDLLIPRAAASTAPPEGHDQWLRLRDEEARAVYEALGEYFGHQVSDNRLLRADYADERRRVDKLTDALITAAIGRPPAINPPTTGLRA